MEAIKQREGGISASTLKIIAIIGMTMDHIGSVFWDQLPVLGRCLLYAPGGLTFPIMAFLLTEGYRHTRNFKSYALRLLMFAAVALLPFAWALNSVFNVLFTLLLGLLVIYLYDNMENRVLFWLAFAGITAFTTFCDWSWMGVPMVLFYHTIQEPRKRVVIPVLLAIGMMGGGTLIGAMLTPDFLFVNALPSLLFVLVGCTATIPLLLNYNGKKGNIPRYFFYAYYPGHLALLALLRGILFGIWI